MTSGSSESSVPAGRPIFIVDSWPVLEWLYLHEPATRFREHLDQADRGEVELWMSRMNRGEVIYNAAIRVGRDRLNEINEKVSGLPITVITVEDGMVDEAAELKISCPLSYADCFVAVLAQRHRAFVMTGDPDFLRPQAAGLLSVDWFGK